MVSVDGDLTIAAGNLPLEEQPPAARWTMLGRLEKAAIGVRRADGVTTVRRREPAGCVLFGPYWQLPAGYYRLNFHCRVGAPRMSSQPVLGLEIIVLNRIQQGWRDFTAADLSSGSASCDFEVPAELGLEAGNEGRFEFKFFHFGNADLSISAVDLLRLPDAEMAPALPRQWRMLGRLQKSWLGRRRGDGAVTVREREPASCLLYGGWPYLRLPRGHYRLSVRCASGIPRMTSQPVLGLEVVGRSRWRKSLWLRPLPSPNETGGIRLAWRDFTAQELGEGSGAAEFEVPMEMALESGDDSPFEFRLFHLGNADLTVRAVDLCWLGEEQPDCRPPPREWRMLARLRKGPVGARTAEGVTVSRDAPAGRLLYGGRPLLRLSEGRFRLNFYCRTGASQRAAVPMLQVKVVARLKSAGGWGSFRTRSVEHAKRDFTAEELRSGSGSMVFEVPSELGRERSNTHFELVFLHGGDAELTISAVEIREEAASEATASPAWLRVARLRASRRKKLLMIGNCQSDILCQALNQIESLNSAFEAKYHFVMLPKHLYETVKRDLETCDIMMIQDVWHWESFPLREYIRDDLETVRFPAVRFASLWPFDGWNGPGDKQAHDREAPNLTFPYLDGLLGRLRKEIPDKEARFRAYRQLQAEGVINYRLLHELEKRRLVAIDNKFGIDIGAFILDNFQKKRLFRTTVRPDRDVLNMLMRYLLKRIGVNGSHTLPNKLKALPESPQIPVHPKVARDLGVKWADENTKYIYGSERITWETYIRRYIDHYG